MQACIMHPRQPLQPKVLYSTQIYRDNNCFLRTFQRYIALRGAIAAVVLAHHSNVTIEAVMYRDDLVNWIGFT